MAGWGQVPHGTGWQCHGRDPQLALGIVSHQASPFPRHVSVTLRHGASSGAGDGASRFAGLSLLAIRQNHPSRVLLPLGEVAIGVPCSFLPGVTLETAESWPRGTAKGSGGSR